MRFDGGASVRREIICIVTILALTPYANPFEWTSGEWDDVREWLIAIGTVGAVITALYVAGRPARARRRRRPKLSLSLDDELGITIETVTLENDKTGSVVASTPAPWIRLSVTNQNGKDTATDVELFAARITEPDAGAAQPRAHVSFPPFGWPHVETARMDVPAGVTRLIDIGWYELNPTHSDVKDKLQLRLVPFPTDQRHLLKPGTYDFDLTLSAHNADARYFTMQVTFDPTVDPPLAVAGPSKK
jgi:hypothetical protein